MVTDAEGIVVRDDLTGDALSVVLDAVGRTHVNHVVLAVEEFDHGMLPGDVGVLDGEVGGLFSAADDEAVFGDGVGLVVVPDGELGVVAGACWGLLVGRCGLWRRRGLSAWEGRRGAG